MRSSGRDDAIPVDAFGNPAHIINARLMRRASQTTTDFLLKQFLEVKNRFAEDIRGNKKKVKRFAVLYQYMVAIEKTAT